MEVLLLKGNPSLVSMSTSVAFELLLEVEMTRIHDDILWIRDPQSFTWYTKKELRIDGSCANYHDAARQIFQKYGASWREMLLLKPTSNPECPWLNTGFFVKIRGRRF